MYPLRATLWSFRLLLAVPLSFSFWLTLSGAAADDTDKNSPPHPADATTQNAPRSVAEMVAHYFRPFEHELAALAPDGRHVALSEFDGGKARIVVVDLDDKSSRRLELSGAPGRDDAVAQLLWQSPERLVFTLRSRSVGVMNVATGQSKPLLRPKDIDAYQPPSRLGARRISAEVTADMPADSSRGEPIDMMTQRVSVDSPLVESLVTQQLFESQPGRRNLRALMPFLLGLKDGSPSAVMVSLRTNRDLFDEWFDQNPRVKLPSNVVVVDSNSSPFGPSDENSTNRLLGYTSQEIIVAPPPHVVLELDADKGGERVALKKDDWPRVVVDHQGRPRLALESSGHRRRFLYRAAEGGRWVPLDSIVKEKTPLGFTVTPETLLAPRSVPLGFDYDGKLLYIATNVGTNTFVLRALDVTTGLLTELEVEHHFLDVVEPMDLLREDVLVFDPYQKRLVGLRMTCGAHGTLWFDPELTQLQASLDKQFSPRRCQICAWDAKRRRFLLDIEAPDDPGAFAVCDLESNKLFECARRAPWLTPEQLNTTLEFSFKIADDGERYLNGCITVPRKPRLDPPPLLVYFHDGPWLCDAPDFNRGVQALASLGFAVVQINYRGSSGSGRTHLNAIDAGFDRIVLEDVKTVIARVANMRLNPRLVAAFGSGFGGYLALRAVQLEPDIFRCAVAINTPADLDAWTQGTGNGADFSGLVRRHFFGDDRAKLRSISALAAAPTTTRPVLVVQAGEDTYVPTWMGRRLYDALKKRDVATEYLELKGEGHGGWSPKTAARLFTELGSFFNATIYNYSVELGPATVAP